jgi:hypothetical protein
MIAAPTLSRRPRSLPSRAARTSEAGRIPGPASTFSAPTQEQRRVDGGPCTVRNGDTSFHGACNAR